MELTPYLLKMVEQGASDLFISAGAPAMMKIDGESIALENAPFTHNGGPHGMHSVYETRVYNHQSEANHNRASCKACHGDDYRGSALSRTFSARSFSTEWGMKKFAAGHAVSCYDCHDGPEGG